MKVEQLVVLKAVRWVEKKVAWMVELMESLMAVQLADQKVDCWVEKSVDHSVAWMVEKRVALMVDW